jgi:hypothetical protein
VDTLARELDNARKKPGIDWANTWPNMYVREWVTSPGCPLSATQRLIAMIIAKHMDRTGVTFISQSKIAKECDLHRRSVQRAWDPLFEGPAAVFEKSEPGETKGHPHQCYRFTLIRRANGPSWGTE